jgi:hypothetical protein
MAFDQNSYQPEYQKRTYDRLVALVPKGRGKEVKAFADAKGISVSRLIIDALEELYKLDLSKADGE